MKLFSAVLCLQIAASAAGCWAAQASTSKPEDKVTGILLPPTVEVSSPFAMDAPDSERVHAIDFLSEKLMAAQDREAIQNASESIEQKAALRGFDLKQGNWNYQQIACPLFPDEMLLSFTRDNGVGDVSKFTAVLPRSGNQPLWIVPVLRRSYSPYRPAPVNAFTIAAFNALRAGEHSNQKMDWLTTGLCYAALSGVDVQLAPGKAASNISLAANSVLQIDENGSASVRFFDVKDPRKVMSWTLAFDKVGKLLSVAVSPVPALKAKVVP